MGCSGEKVTEGGQARKSTHRNILGVTSVAERFCPFQLKSDNREEAAFREAHLACTHQIILT